MTYMGSKNRISKELLPIITKYLTEDKHYIEPFVGGANMIDKVKHDKKIGADSNEFLILMFQELQNGWKPPVEINERKYKLWRKLKPLHPKTAFYGFTCSFGAKWFGSFARNKKGTNYALQGFNNLMKQLPNILDIDFIHSSYYDLDIPDNSIIYCDPPYIGTTGYKDKFNHDLFYEWIREREYLKGILFIYLNIQLLMILYLFGKRN